MSVRDGMLDIIGRVRELIGDESEEQFTTQHIQDVLDRTSRVDAWYEELVEQGTILSGGSVRYYDFYSPHYPWEGTPTLYNGSYLALTGTLAASTVDYMRGYWHFTGSVTPPYGPVRPVRVVGNHYDVHFAASALLEEWAAAVKTHVSFRDPNFSFQMNEQYQHLRDLAAHYRAMCPVATIKMVRGDT